MHSIIRSFPLSQTSAEARSVKFKNLGFHFFEFFKK
jgi:hypothetical protein